ncbi:multinuclear nonheme iron-dependent oxidase [Dyadobacter luticola]|uniref:DUF692 domain-containing protein n=1 Tax=Dyadobacter luticola TaxID=1979387 RepID=A0A5R9KR22_9BACT|nr:DUF692 family multinuclear iron-containing protein [Dyadobacter luticola]TLU98745.1 DUF692 domain-containing protein [Dyadobacter luticola]
MSEIYASVACNLDIPILQASLPLFEEGKIEGIEWSFDALFKWQEIPGWFTDLVHEFSENNRLVGHGVYFSLFSGKWSPEQQQWLEKLRKLSGDFHFDHVSEHFGFLTGDDFHKGAPIGIPFTNSTLTIGRDRLRRIQDACQCPVGLENLAFSYSLEEVKRHGEFLDALVEEVNGFIILDLHNLYCQSHNFNIPFDQMMRLYPLDRVREIHISGGSWDDQLSGFEKIVRRDTHDESVPEEVFEYLKLAIPQCKNLKYVVLEQLGAALETSDQQETFRNDFLKMQAIIQHPGTKSAQSVSDFVTKYFSPLSPIPPEDPHLYRQQKQLSDILENAADSFEAFKMLQNSTLANSDWRVENWEPVMLETAIAIARKWKNGF